MSNNVDHPAHYNKGKIEVIDFIEDQNLNFHLGNVVKYVCRSRHKDGLAALEKAHWYLTREIQRLKYPDLTSKQAQAHEREQAQREEH